MLRSAPASRLLLGLLGSCALHCASSSASSPEVILEEGGELRLAQVPAATSTVGAEHVEVWAQTQLPANSRLQPAVATIQSITRAEFVKLLETRVESAMVDRAAQSGEEFEQSITLETMEHIRTRLSRALPIETGWARVQRGDETHLRMVGRVKLPIIELRGILEDIPALDPELAQGILAP